MSVVFFFILVSEKKEKIQLANLNIPSFTSPFPTLNLRTAAYKISFLGEGEKEELGSW